MLTPVTLLFLCGGWGIIPICQSSGTILKVRDKCKNINNADN